MPDASFLLRDGVDGEAFKLSMLRHNDVRKAFGYEAGGATMLIDETSVNATIVEDSSLLEGQMLLDGRYPRHENEIALGTAISRVAGKNTGDTVTVRIDDNKREYLVSGIVQNPNNSGFNGMITEDGWLSMQPDFVFTAYNVYLNEGVDVDGFIENVQRQEGDIFVNSVNILSQLSGMMESMGDIFAAVAVGVLAVTVFVVALTLYMIIKTTILRRRRELGIQKAIGFTTLQLMNQIAFNMLPVIVIGVAAGAVLGYIGFNPMMAATMAGMGVVRVDLPVSASQTTMVCIALITLAYIVSMLIAVRIRKISAYTLVTE
jgi:putative ABC transport system permease protein